MNLGLSLFIDLMSVYLINQSNVWETLMDILQNNLTFYRQKTKMTPPNVLLCPQHKDIQFNVKEQKSNQNMFTFKRLVSENLGLIFFFKKGWLRSKMNVWMYFAKNRSHNGLCKCVLTIFLTLFWKTTWFYFVEEIRNKCWWSLLMPTLAFILYSALGR